MKIKSLKSIISKKIFSIENECKTPYAYLNPKDPAKKEEIQNHCHHTVTRWEGITYLDHPPHYCNFMLENLPNILVIGNSLLQLTYFQKLLEKLIRTLCFFLFFSLTKNIFSSFWTCSTFFRYHFFDVFKIKTAIKVTS